MEMEGSHQFCLMECLEKRIKADFSSPSSSSLPEEEEDDDKRRQLTFVYGISGESPLPFASSAVVQLPRCGAGEASAPQFILTYIPRAQDRCISSYIDECCVNGLEGSRSEDAVSVAVIGKDQAEVSAGIPSDKNTTCFSKSTQCQYVSNGGTSPHLPHGLGSESLTCEFSGWYSCFRTITALAPNARIGISSYDLFEEIASDFWSGVLEDHSLGSLSLLIEGKAAGREAINFLNLLGVSSFSDVSFPGCVRHPNIAPILGMFKAISEVNLVVPKTPYTLENILHYSPGALKYDWHNRFMIYQLLSALSYMHGLGIAHGNVRPSSMMLTDSSWCWLRIDDSPKLNSKVVNSNSSTSTVCSSKNCTSQGLFADLKLSQSMDWQSSFYSWYNGELSNFEYLLILNKLAGRRWGDHTFHTVMPWVVDFSVKPDESNEVGWRDLSKSKWRLAKGDEQLDFTYLTSEIPHHISDECLSELAVCSYKARRLPLNILKMAVRSVYEPNEYPSTMQRLYQWTPDECIPEFYCDPRIFFSLHSGMSDLSVPPWARSPEEFIKLHRNALESNLVSSRIHHWIDITFGYKMSGQAAIDAKNVMLPPAASEVLRSAGRRQLFYKPHPARRFVTKSSNLSPVQHYQANDSAEGQTMDVISLHHLEEAASFCEHAQHLSPVYDFHVYDHLNDNSHGKELETYNASNRGSNHGVSGGVKSVIDVKFLIENIEVDDDDVGYQELLVWGKKNSCSNVNSVDVADDIFAVGCILAELYLNRPLFNSNTIGTYLESGILPSSMEDLPLHVQVVVRSCIRKEWKRRPSVKCLLESPFFPGTVRSAYLFLAPLQLLAKEESRLRYAATFSKQGALKVMGSFAAEICASYCLPLVKTTLSDIQAEWAYILLNEFLKCLKPEAIRDLVLPAIQKILQAPTYSHLKVSLLQGSFVLDLWNRIGKQAYLEAIHPLVLSNLFVSTNKSSAAAASVLLIGSCEELGVPVTVYQTILPLIHYLGKGLCDDGIDAVVRIGCLLGEDFIVKHILPLLKNLMRFCINQSSVNKPELIQGYSTSLINSFNVLDGLVAQLSRETIVKELIENGGCLYVEVIMHYKFSVSVLQAAATKLIVACEQIGPEFTELHVLPKLKVLFDELAFSQENSTVLGRLGGASIGSTRKMNEEDCYANQLDLVLFLYPSFASLLGIQKLRQCCATWLLLEQLLLRHYNWKWEYTGESYQSGLETANTKKLSFSKRATSDYVPAKMLLNGVGWSIPQKQGKKSARNLTSNKPLSDRHQTSDARHEASSNIGKHEPWFWFPGSSSILEGLDFSGRVNGPKDEFPWKIRASTLHSVRAHHGALRSIAVCEDECSVFTAGVGPGFKGTVQKWELSRVDCVSGYYGHEEVVNDICVLTSLGRVASCDGTVHVWNAQTGKLITVFSEFSSNSTHSVSPLSAALKVDREEGDALHYNPSSVGVLNNAFDGSFYTCMHYSQFSEMLIVGAGNGSLRFIDLNHGRKLHLWRSNESNFPSLVSSISSCGSNKLHGERANEFPSWIAAGLSSGHCTLFDARSGDIIASWQAHDGYVTELAAPSDRLLVSSSLDKTLRIWDLRRSYKKCISEPIIFKGHTDGVSGFSIWGQDVISIARNRIGLTSLVRFGDEDGECRIMPQYLYTAERDSRNMSALSSISILPFSRLFLVGTEDGYLKICC
ncbi:OLC1v1025407C1 [Oldenlandia corymbosa var. corymbosa]|uniref:OLC1v1025407C1 n=1 Tax=Oldenlandia corymbosa var. corymbosa TaxID=529605 RepID=A0AAV1C6T1_OLDCO|nr:OLC1v1025407C1 [Oldenlandia corymbosa var. corymbosa]